MRPKTSPKKTHPMPPSQRRKIVDTVRKCAEELERAWDQGQRSSSITVWDVAELLTKIADAIEK